MRGPSAPPGPGLAGPDLLPGPGHVTVHPRAAAFAAVPHRGRPGAVFRLPAAAVRPGRTDGPHRGCTHLSCHLPPCCLGSSGPVLAVRHGSLLGERFAIAERLQEARPRALACSRYTGAAPRGGPRRRVASVSADPERFGLLTTSRFPWSAPHKLENCWMIAGWRGGPGRDPAAVRPDPAAGPGRVRRPARAGCGGRPGRIRRTADVPGAYRDWLGPQGRCGLRTCPDKARPGLPGRCRRPARGGGGT
jgi:hypothetical protein